jgi:hypothetical protein
VTPTFHLDTRHFTNLLSMIGACSTRDPLFSGTGRTQPMTPLHAQSGSGLRNQPQPHRPHLILSERKSRQLLLRRAADHDGVCGCQIYETLKKRKFSQVSVAIFWATIASNHPTTSVLCRRSGFFQLGWHPFVEKTYRPVGARHQIIPSKPANLIVSLILSSTPIV